MVFLHTYWMAHGDGQGAAGGEVSAVTSVRSAIHFVGFRGNEYISARRVWGVPDFIHRGWDRRAQREIYPTDTVVFANGAGDAPPRAMSYQDLNEDELTD